MYQKGRELLCMVNTYTRIDVNLPLLDLSPQQGTRHYRMDGATTPHFSSSYAAAADDCRLFPRCYWNVQSHHHCQPHEKIHFDLSVLLSEEQKYFRL